MEAIMDKIAEKKRMVDGVPTSLQELGFEHVGLDDGWQKCGAGAYNSFHDVNGNPIVDLDRFPNLTAMTTHAHSLGLSAGWYANNCNCKELSCKYQPPPCWEGNGPLTKHMVQSANAVAEFGFDGVKLDGCGEFRNLTWWSELLNATGRRVLIENCHGPPFPTWPNDTTAGKGGDGPCTGTTLPSDCPYHMYRTSDDITNNFGSMYNNLLSTRPFQGAVPLSRPGGWAYPVQ
jgi:alpha-galactosidase